MRAALLKIVETLQAGGARRLLTSVDILQRATQPPTSETPAVAEASGRAESRIFAGARGRGHVPPMSRPFPEMSHSCPSDVYE